MKNRIKNKIKEVIEFGVALPIFNYEEKKFVVRLPLNVRLVNAKPFGVEHIAKCDEFEQALDYVIDFFNDDLEDVSIIANPKE